jgi:hypothetical protein
MTSASLEYPKSRAAAAQAATSIDMGQSQYHKCLLLPTVLPKFFYSSKNRRNLPLYQCRDIIATYGSQAIMPYSYLGNEGLVQGLPQATPSSTSSARR